LGQLRGVSSCSRAVRIWWAASGFWWWVGRLQEVDFRRSGVVDGLSCSLQRMARSWTVLKEAPFISGRRECETLGWKRPNNTGLQEAQQHRAERGSSTGLQEGRKPIAESARNQDDLSPWVWNVEVRTSDVRLLPWVRNLSSSTAIPDASGSVQSFEEEPSERSARRDQQQRTSDRVAGGSNNSKVWHGMALEMVQQCLVQQSSVWWWRFYTSRDSECSSKQ